MPDEAIHKNELENDDKALDSAVLDAESTNEEEPLTHSEPEALPESPAPVRPVHGAVKVPEAVYAEIVRRVAAAIPGVASVIYRSGASAWFRHKGIRVRRCFRGRLKVDVAVVLRHGASIPETALAIQDAVSEELASVSGCRIRSVRVCIDDVLPPPPRSKAKF